MKLIVMIACPDKEDAERIGGVLLDERLAACVNVVPGVSSRFWWGGKVLCAEEAILIAKSKKKLLRKLTDMVKQIHQYETPEIIAVPVVGGSKEYREWIEKETS